MISFSGLRRMLKAYSNNSFSDPESQKSTAVLMEEVNIGRAQFPRFNDERVIFRTLVCQPIWPLFAFPFSWQNNLVWGMEGQVLGKEFEGSGKIRLFRNICFSFFLVGGKLPKIEFSKIEWFLQGLETMGTCNPVKKLDQKHRFYIQKGLYLHLSSSAVYRDLG